MKAYLEASLWFSKISRAQRPYISFTWLLYFLKREGRALRAVEEKERKERGGDGRRKRERERKKFWESDEYFMLRSSLNSDWAHFKCSVATCT